MEHVKRSPAQFLNVDARAIKQKILLKQYFFVFVQVFRGEIYLETLVLGKIYIIVLTVGIPLDYVLDIFEAVKKRPVNGFT